MAKRTDMGKKFVKRSGKGFDQIKADKMVNFFKEKIHEKFKTLKKEQAIKKIKELYKYEEVSFLGLII